VKDQISCYFGDQLIPEASSFKYSYFGIILSSDLNWADHVNYTLRKSWKALHFIMCILKQGNNNMKRLAYTVLVSPILEYGAVCRDPHREGQVSALNRVQKRAAKLANNIKGGSKMTGTSAACLHTNQSRSYLNRLVNESGWETLAQRRLVARKCALFKACTGRRACKATSKTTLPE